MLDQHNEKKIKDPAVARLFDTCRFAGRKACMIGLLARVVTVSVRDLPAYDAFMLDWDTRNNMNPVYTVLRIVHQEREELELRAGDAQPYDAAIDLVEKG